MSLVNHCDFCQAALPEEFALITVGRDRTPTKMHVRRHEFTDADGLKVAEVCSEACAVQWLRREWQVGALASIQQPGEAVTR